MIMQGRLRARSSQKGGSAGGQNNMSRSIMMRKYGLEEAQAHVDQNTLLEPNNFIPSWETGDEEKKEVSNALRRLRLKYDAIHKFVVAKEEQLEQLKVTDARVQLQQKGVEKAGEEEIKVEKETSGTNLETEQANQELADVTNEHDFEKMYHEQYKYMLDRMKKDLIALQLISNDLVESLRSKRQIMTDELNKQRKSKENKLQSKYRLDHLMKNIEREQDKRKERIESLQTSIKNKEDALQKRMDRVQRQSEIAEAAANENKDQNEVKMRENFMVQKMWSQYYKMKMNKEMNRSHVIEDAFQRIRSQTAITDVQEIVYKFQTREQTYANLLQAVSEQEQRLEKLRQSTEEKREFLQKLQMEHNSLVKGQNKGPSKINPKSADAAESEILKLENEIQFLEKELGTLNDRRKKIHLVSDQVGGWSNRVVFKLNSQLLGSDENIKSGHKNSLTSLFDQITEVVCTSLEEIISTQAQSQAEDMNMTIAKDFLKDLENEEFFSKNFRVRPVSGVTGINDERQSEHYSRNNLAGSAIGEPTEEEDKVNKMMYLEMEEQRRKIKTLRDDAKNTAENNVSLLNSLAHVARVKDKEKNLHTKLKAKKELHFNEKQEIKGLIGKLIS